MDHDTETTCGMCLSVQGKEEEEVELGGSNKPLSIFYQMETKYKKSHLMSHFCVQGQHVHDASAARQGLLTPAGCLQADANWDISHH